MFITRGNISIADIIAPIKYGKPFYQTVAIYRNPARSLAEFVEFYNQNKENPKEQNKIFYRFSTASSAEVDVPFNRVKHIDKRHSFSKNNGPRWKPPFTT